ncbi:MAG: type IV secretory system conjugative DNA transfer family protein [Thermaerobacter sp.]|nr:type IV secretory system conjugative DNA transfer family protein [Thermaerobacter sp.]
MTSQARSFLRWLSALVLAYLGLFMWVDGVVRLAAPLPPVPISRGLAFLTIVLSLRIVWFHERWAPGLSGASLLGLVARWQPLTVLLPCLFAGAWVIMSRYQPRHKTLLGHRLPIPWPVVLDPADRFLHLHVLGPTGSGKSSSVLMPLMAQDIAQGHGVLVLEPKGDLSEAAYRRALACGRSVIRFDPGDAECPHFNPLSGPADQAAEGLVWSLNQISSGGHPYYAVAARVRLLHAVRLIKEFHGENADIGHVLAFFRDGALQRRMAQVSQDSAAREYFQEQWARKVNASREDQQGLINRLELLWANPAVRRVLTGPADFTWDEVLQDRWVILCPLSLAILGESAKALGTLIWHGAAQAAYRRNPAISHHPFFIYLDEFYQWVSDDLGDFLALARGYAVGLVLAHQDMGQLSPALIQAVSANARHRIIMPGSAAEDIRAFRQSADPFTVNARLRYLARGRAILQTTRNGRLMPPWLVRLPHYSLAQEGSNGL